MLAEFSLDQSWEFAERMLVNLGYNATKEGVAALKTLWLENKKHLLPFFDHTGRIIHTADEFSTIDFKDIQHVVRTQCLEHIRSKANAEDVYLLTDILAYFCFYLVTPEELKQNRLLKDRPNPANQDKKLNKGTKASKYFQLWMQNNILDSKPNDKQKHILETSLSLLIKALTSTKNVIISLNPLDYLLASVSPNFSSCFDIQKGNDGGGIYKTSTLSYLCDNKTLLAYVYRSTFNPFSNPLEHVEVPAKIWRAWVHLGSTIPVALVGRQYPQSQIQTQEALYKPLQDLLCNVHNYAGDFRNIDYIHGDYLVSDVVNYRAANKYLLYTDGPTACVKAETLTKKIKLRIGSEGIPCIRCGEIREDHSAKSFYCPHCDNKAPIYYCNGCRNHFTSDVGAVSISPSVIYCPSCVRENYHVHYTPEPIYEAV